MGELRALQADLLSLNLSSGFYELCDFKQVME